MIDVFMFADRIDDESSFFPSILCDLFDRVGESSSDDMRSDFLIFIAKLDVFEDDGRLEESNSSSGDDPFVDGCFGRIEGVFDAEFLLLHLDLTCSTDFDNCNPTCELRNPFSELLFVVIGFS